MQPSSSEDYCGWSYMLSLALMLHFRANSGHQHVTQIRTCDCRCRLAGHRLSGANPRFCLARRLGLARWMGTCVGAAGRGVAAAVGVALVSSWRRDFTEEVASFATSGSG